MKVEKKEEEEEKEEKGQERRGRRRGTREGEEEEEGMEFVGLRRERRGRIRERGIFRVRGGVFRKKIF